MAEQGTVNALVVGSSPALRVRISKHRWTGHSDYSVSSFFKVKTHVTYAHGSVAEWLIAAVLKTAGV